MVQVYILAGQSNMQGKVNINTFEHVGLDPKTAPMLQDMQDPNGNPRVLENVYISALTSDKDPSLEKHGTLTAGPYACPMGGAPKMGPEFTFGIYLEKLLSSQKTLNDDVCHVVTESSSHEQQPSNLILLIKTAWGGKSLHTDFRSPGSGPYQPSEKQLTKLEKKGEAQKKEWQQRKAKATGECYRRMIDHIHMVLSDISRVIPHYHSNQGYEIAGFVWFQGWNDMVDDGAYPNRRQPGGYDLYTSLLSQFIRDVRKDLNVPDLPFVIGKMGVGGIDNHKQTLFRQAMEAPAHELNNVAVVDTEIYWDPVLSDISQRYETNVKKIQRQRLGQNSQMTPLEKKEMIRTLEEASFTPQELELRRMGISNFEFHYFGSAKIIGQIGKAFAEAMYDLRNYSNKRL